MNETPILGEGPHKLNWRATWGVRTWGLLFVFISLLVLFVSGLFLSDTIVALGEESDIWESGIVSPEANVGEDWTTNGDMVDSYTVPVHWMDESGEHHVTEQAFSVLFDQVDEGEPMEVRYRSTDDGYAIATSWSESVRFGRWAGALFLFLFGFVFASLAMIIGVGTARRGSHAARTLRDFDEVWLRVVGVLEDKSDGPMELIFTLLDEENESQFMQRFKNGPPLTLGPDDEHVLALRRRSDNDLLVLRRDLYPLSKSEDEARDIWNRASQPKA